MMIFMNVLDTGICKEQSIRTLFSSIYRLPWVTIDEDEKYLRISYPSSDKVFDELEGDKRSLTDKDELYIKSIIDFIPILFANVVYNMNHQVGLWIIQHSCDFVLNDFLFTDRRVPRRLTRPIISELLEMSPEEVCKLKREGLPLSYDAEFLHLIEPYIQNSPQELPILDQFFTFYVDEYTGKRVNTDAGELLIKKIQYH